MFFMNDFSSFWQICLKKTLVCIVYDSDFLEFIVGLKNLYHLKPKKLVILSKKKYLISYLMFILFQYVCLSDENVILCMG